MIISEVRNNEVRRRITILRRKSNPWRSKWVTKTTPALSEPEPHPDPAAGKPDL